MKATEEVLSDFIAALGRSRSPEEFLGSLPKALNGIAKLDEIAVAFLSEGKDEEFDARNLSGGRGWSGRMPLNGSAVAAAVEKDGPLAEAGIGKYSDYFDVRELAEGGLKSYVILPLTCEGRSFATLNLASADEHAFRGKGMQLLKLASDYVAKALYALMQSDRARKQSTSAAISRLMPHIYFSLGEDFRLSFVDGDPQRLLGYSTSELAGMRLSNIVHSDDYKRLDTVLKDLNKGTHVKDVDFTFITKDGAHRRFEFRGWRNGQMADCLILPAGVQQENGEQGEIPNLFGLSSDAIYTMDLFGVVRTWNKAAARLFGYEAREIVGTEARRLFADGSTRELDELMRKLGERKGILLSQARRMGKNSTPLVVMSSATSLLDDDGKVTGYMEILRDMSTGILLEESRRDLRSQTVKNKVLMKQDEEKSKFISDVSHELRTPLTNIHGYAALLRDGEVGELSKGQREFVDIIHGQTNRLSKLISDVLDLSKIESRKFKFDMRFFDPRTLETQCSCSSMAEAKGLYVRWSFGPEVTDLYGDPAKLAQVIINLISNAIKFTNSGGITVHVKNKSRTFMQFDVTDTGVGIPAEEIPKLFKRFSQLSTGLRKEGGTGLGLAITRQIVKQHGGTIWAKSDPGKGTTFSFTLRRVPPKSRKK